MKKIILEHRKSLTKKEVLQRLISHFSRKNISGKKSLIICEDNTRSTPIDLFFEEFLLFLLDKAKSVTVLFALGTHRPMTRNEMLNKLGISSQLAKQIKMINHNAFDQLALIKIGKIDSIELQLNKAVAQNDFIITIGSVLPHRVMGFSGGAKMLCPGVANKEMIDHTHWKSNLFPESQIMAKIENPMRETLDKIAKTVQAKFPHKSFHSINCVTGPLGIIDIFIGDFSSSYKQAAQFSSQLFVKRVKECSSILALLDDKSIDFWQAAKAVYNCARVITDGGTIVVHGALKEKISSIHGPIIEKFGYSNPEKIQELFETGELEDQVVASHMIRVSQHLQRIKIFLSSENITREICKRVNLGYLRPRDIENLEFDHIVYNSVDIVLERK